MVAPRGRVAMEMVASVVVVMVEVARAVRAAGAAVAEAGAAAEPWEAGQGVWAAEVAMEGMGWAATRVATNTSGSPALSCTCLERHRRHTA